MASTASSLGSAGAGIAAGALIGGPVGMAVGAGAGALINLIGSIGQGRKTANKMTENGGPQDILDQQLQAIDADPNTDAMGKAQATAVAYGDFLQAAGQFAATQGPEAAKVVQQAVYKTPGLQNTLNSLMAPLGVTAWSPQFTQIIPGITATSDTSNYNGQSSNTLGNVFGGAAIGGGASAGTEVLGSLLNGGNGNPLNTGGLLTGGIGPTDAGSAAGIGSLGGVAGGSQAPVYDANGNIVAGTAAIPNAGTMNPNTGAIIDPNTGQVVQQGSSGGIGGILSSILTGKNNSSIGGLLSGALGLAAPIVGGVLQSNAASSAAQIQANAAIQAAQLQSQTAANSLNFQKQVYGTEQQQIAPFVQAGTNALGQAQQFLGNLQPFQAPTAQQAAQTPGYQFQFDEAMRALGRQSAGVTSGGSIRAAEQYANNLAASNYQQTYNNALQTYQTNYQNQLNPLLQLAGSGQNAVTGNAAAGQQAANSVANINQQAATGVNQANQGAAYYNAAGNIAGTNALTNALQSVANLTAQRQQLSQSSG